MISLYEWAGPKVNMTANIQELLDFTNFTYQVREVRRGVILSDNSAENDAEHMYQMGLMAMFIIDSNDLKLDKFRCVAMALLHDVLEAYAGDTVAFAPANELEGKKTKEAKAIEKLKSTWPSFTSMHELIHEYEELKTPESKFVYALDKLAPEINNYLSGGKAWKKMGINIEQVKKIKEGKIEKDPTIHAYHDEILKLIEADPSLFDVTTS